MLKAVWPKIMRIFREPCMSVIEIHCSKSSKSFSVCPKNSIIFEEPIGKLHSDEKVWVNQLLDRCVMVQIEMIPSQYSVDGGFRLPNSLEALRKLRQFFENDPSPVFQIYLT